MNKKIKEWNSWKLNIIKENKLRKSNTCSEKRVGIIKILIIENFNLTYEVEKCKFHAMNCTVKKRD